MWASSDVLLCIPGAWDFDWFAWVFLLVWALFFIFN